MKTIIYILILLSTISTYSQVYVNLQGGTAENKQTTNTTLTYQVGFRYQPSDFGFKAGVKFALKTLDATIKETVKEKNVLCSNCGCETEKMGEDYWCRICHNEMDDIIYEAQKFIEKYNKSYPTKLWKH